MDEAKFLTVRRVTQNNRGKDFAGVNRVSKLKLSGRYS